MEHETFEEWLKKGVDLKELKGLTREEIITRNKTNYKKLCNLISHLPKTEPCYIEVFKCVSEPMLVKGLPYPISNPTFKRIKTRVLAKWTSLFNFEIYGMQNELDIFEINENTTFSFPDNQGGEK